MRSIMTVALVALFPLSAAMAQTTNTPAAPARAGPVTTKWPGDPDPERERWHRAQGHRHGEGARSSF